MDYKQKYEQALERAKVINPGTADYEVAVKIFPELKESEDEKIRKEIIQSIQDNMCVIHKDKCIAWLEKQGKQKSSDKVEPRFHEGDWVVYKNDICQIVKREEGCNKLVTVFGIEKELVNERNLSTARLWTIQDAKNGDILTDKQNCTCIFREIMTDEGETSVDAYCGITIDNEFVANEKGEIWTVPEDLFPATKEQCTLLFQKMHEAGYEWDAEKKELKKIKRMKK